MKTYIYKLKLEFMKYYVGISDDPITAIKTHSNGNHCKWTHHYKPVEVLEVKEIDKEHSNTILDHTVINLRNKFGKENVRGGAWTDFKNPDENNRLHLMPYRDNPHANTIYIRNIISKFEKIKSGKTPEQYKAYEMFKPSTHYVDVKILKSDDNKFCVSHAFIRGEERDYFHYENEWVRNNNVNEVIKEYTNLNFVQCKKLTFELMARYGYQNVRGYSWKQEYLKSAPKDLDSYISYKANGK